jgi:hypothetical protein
MRRIELEPFLLEKARQYDEYTVKISVCSEKSYPLLEL